MVAHRRRRAWRREVALPIDEDEPRTGLEDPGRFRKTRALVGNCPNHVNANDTVDTRGVEAGRVKARSFVRDRSTKTGRTRPRASMFERNFRKVDTRQSGTGGSCDPLPRCATPASEVVDSLTRNNAERIGHRTKFAARYVTVGSCLLRIL